MPDILDYFSDMKHQRSVRNAILHIRRRLGRPDFNLHRLLYILSLEAQTYGDFYIPGEFTSGALHSEFCA